MLMDEIPNTVRADVAVVASGALQATGGGVLEQRTVLERAGRYRFSLTLPGGDVARFTLTATTPEGATRARPERRRLETRVGEPLAVRFQVSGAAPAEASVLAYGGRRGEVRQLHVPARRVGARGFEATLRFPTPGRFRIELLSEEAGLRPGAGAGASVRVRTQAP
jgi:hypothetical protein